MSNMKFRAIINKNTIIYFTFKDLMDNKFSNREILWKWLKNNEPDRFTGVQDKNDKDIYENDILFGIEEGDGETTAWTDVYYFVYFEKGVFWARDKNINKFSHWSFYLQDLCYEYEIVGNKIFNPELYNKFL